MKNLTETIYAKISSDLKKRTKKQAIDIGIDYKDYINLAMIHFADHVEKKEISFNDSRFNK